MRGHGGRVGPRWRFGRRGETERNPQAEARWAATTGAASEAGTHRSRPGGAGKALRWLRPGPAADCRRDQRTLRIHSRFDEGDSGRLSEVRLRLYGEDRHQASATDRKEHGGSELISASNRGEMG